MIDPTVACENLMEELLAFFWPTPTINEPHYSNKEQFQNWLQSRSTRPWEDVAARKQRKRRKPKSTKDGRVYILKIELEGIVVYKVGTTNKKVVRRMLEIVESLNFIKQ